ncbi:hypothetical protein [Polycladidibacter stylochi]|uniref:hypothetical protein n=1 Tax=Polycladidibacter stylochi TaxID=1807766 RepID=UPI0008370E95|nr:hypothetical protein [Pseudovibrio stylochi]
MTMTATVTDFGQIKDRKPSFLRRAFDCIIAARQESVQRQVNHYLLRLTDEELNAAGYDRKELLARRSAPAAY